MSPSRATIQALLSHFRGEVASGQAAAPSLDPPQRAISESLVRKLSPELVASRGGRGSKWADLSQAEDGTMFSENVSNPLFITLGYRLSLPALSSCLQYRLLVAAIKFYRPALLLPVSCTVSFPDSATLSERGWKVR